MKNIELSKTLDYIDKVHEILLQKYNAQPKALVRTFGCQQNVSDSEYIKGMLEKMGYALTEEVDKADFILYNTCAVREHAEDRAFGNIGALKSYKEKNPDLIIAMCGCMVSQPAAAEKIKNSYPYVSLAFGTNMLERFPEMLYKYIRSRKRVIDISGASADGGIVEGLPRHRDSSLKAWLPIMYGCNNFCTYCVVPLVRGRERSRDYKSVVAEAEELVASGAKDITLLGQNVNSYGKGNSDGVYFPELLRMINDIKGDFRIRFMTSHPKDCSDELLKAMSECDKVARHLHLPFQSGSDRILKAMNRHYTSSDYLRLVDKARSLMPDISLTSDIIVGFPGEEYEDFLKTVDIIKKVRFSMLFTFIYSKRDNTPAAKMEDKISEAEKGRWFEELLHEQEIISDEIMRGFIGKELRVLCEGVKPKTNLLYGRAGNNMSVTFSGGEECTSKFVRVKITDFNHTVLKGELTN